MPIQRLRQKVGRALRNSLGIPTSGPKPEPVVWQMSSPAGVTTWLDRHVAITGAGGLLGSALVEALVRLGAHVHAIDHGAAALERLEAAHGSSLSTYLADLTDEEAVISATSALARETDALDALIHCIGANDYPDENSTISAAQWRSILAINLIAPAIVTDALIPLLAKRRAAGVVMVTSINGRTTSQWRHYAAAKAGLAKLTQDLASRLAPQAIRVNAVAPGWFAEPTPEGTMPRSSQLPLTSSAMPVEAFVHAALFLADPRLSPCTTGQELVVDAGAEIRPTW